MLKAYFDESGIHSDSHICVVAGFVLSSKWAVAMSNEWQNNVLYKYRIPYFHAKEFAQRQGPFRGWSDKQLRDFSIDAIAVISTCLNPLDSSAVIATALTSKSFLALSVDQRRWLTGGQYVDSGDGDRKKWKKQGAPTKPYFLLFQQAVLDAVKLTQDTDFHGRGLGTGDHVHFIFDQQTEYEPTARAVFRAMKRMPISVRDRMGDIVFSSKMREIPLQVADFFAYESFAYLCLRETTGKDALTNQAYRLFETIWHRQLRSTFINDKIWGQLLTYCPMKPKERFVLPDPRLNVGP